MLAEEKTDSSSSIHFLDYWRVIRSRKEIILAVIILVVLTGIGFTLTLPKIYQAQTRIKINQDQLDVEVFSMQNVPMYNPFFLRTEYEVIKSQPVLKEVLENLDLARIWGERDNDDGSPLTHKQAYKRLRKNVQVEQYRDTTLIAILATSEDPDEAARVANEVGNVYREYRLRVNRDKISDAIDVLKKELDKQKRKVDLAEEELERVRKEYGVSFVQEGQVSTKIQVQQLQLERSAARVEMLVRKARMEELSALDGEELMNASSYLVNDGALSAIRRQLIDTEVSLSLLKENYGVNHPEVRRVQAAVDELKSKLTTALAGLKKGLRADYQVAVQKFQALDEELEQTQQKDIDVAREQVLPFNKAQRDLLVQRSILDALQSRVAQQGIEFEVPRTPVEIIDVAEVPVNPVSPNLLLNIFLSIVLGVASGVALAFFIEYLDTSMRTVEDVERNLGVSVIGVIPQKVKHLIDEGPESPHAESYRVLRTNLQFNLKDSPGSKAIAVTSGGVGEGKSTTLNNLACVCAQLGDRVLVIDSDLRRPIQHKIMGLSNRVGLTDVLLKEVAFEELIIPTKEPNLHFLPSGRLSRSLVGMMDARRVRELIEQLKPRYDFIFFDSPPLMGISDSSVLSSETDGVLMVVQYRKYPRIISSRAKRILESVGANILGVVLNNINIMRDDYYYYYHSYASNYYQSEDSLPESSRAAPKKEKLI